MLQFSIGKVMIRDRTRSVAEKINGSATGDAAFANYVWMASYTLRVPNKRSRVEQSALPAGGVTAALAPVKTQSATPPEKFKPFNLKTLDGKRATLKDFSNKVTLVNFFYPRCPFCNVELPEIQKIYDRFKDKGLSAVWINILPEEEKLIPGWLLAKNLSVPVLVGGSQEALQRDYRIESTPSTFLLDENGQILFWRGGYTAGDEKELEAKIAAALSVALPAPPVQTQTSECPSSEAPAAGWTAFRRFE